MTRCEYCHAPILERTDRIEDDLARTMRVVCAFFGVQERHLIGGERTAPVSAARHAVRYLLHRRWSLSLIGRAMGTDHTTVAHSVTQARKRLAEDPGFAERIAKCEAALADPAEARSA